MPANLSGYLENIRPAPTWEYENVARLQHVSTGYSQNETARHAYTCRAAQSFGRAGRPQSEIVMKKERV